MSSGKTIFSAETKEAHMPTFPIGFVVKIE
jgi:hypothetical protein